MRNLRFQIFTIFLLFSVPTLSFATELSLSAALGGANLNTVKHGGIWGPGLQLTAQYSFDEFWMIAITASGSHHFESMSTDKENSIIIPADTVLNTSFRLVYLIDIVEYIPYFGLGPTLYMDVPRIDGAEAQTNLGASLIFGVDWRYSRYYSLGAFGELHALATDLNRYPVYSFVGFRWTYHLRF